MGLDIWLMKKCDCFPEGREVGEWGVTYNYSRIYIEVMGCTISELLEKASIQQAIPIIEEAIKALGVDRDENDYWKPTRGNAGYALSTLLPLLKANPDCEVHMWK
jgi:hypothetical protein